MSIKELKEQFLLEETSKLFLENSIEGITIKDIAKHVGVGEATIYRMFGKKENLVAKVAVKLQKEIFEKYFHLDNSNSGYEKMVSYYSIFLRIFESHVEYFKFINEFDNFMIVSKFQELNDYENNMSLFIKEFKDAYEEGLKDGTVKEVDDIDLFYYSTMHALLSLCKKMASSPILTTDEKISKTKEIQTLIQIIMFNLKK